MAGHAQLKFVMTECSKTQIRLTGPNGYCFSVHEVVGENSGMTQEMLNNLYPWDPKKVSYIGVGSSGTHV